LFDKGVYYFALQVNLSCVLELCSQVELATHVELFLKKVVNPALEHACAHGFIVETVD